MSYIYLVLVVTSRMHVHHIHMHVTCTLRAVQWTWTSTSVCTTTPSMVSTVSPSDWEWCYSSVSERYTSESSDWLKGGPRGAELFHHTDWGKGEKQILMSKPHYKSQGGWVIAPGENTECICGHPQLDSSWYTCTCRYVIMKNHFLWGMTSLLHYTW